MKTREIVRILFLLLVTGLITKETKAQVDPHFSQYYMYPSWLNPALTGAFDGDYRVSGIYRNQWSGISTFSTPGISADFVTDKNMNFGGSIMNQVAGDGAYSYLTAYASAAYTGVRFGAGGSQYLVFGLDAGLIQRKFDPSKLNFGDQWSPATGFPTNMTRDFITRTTAASFDASAGVLYYDGQTGKKANIFGGVSVSHLTRPDDKFSASGDARIPMRFTVHGGVKLVVSEVFNLTPNFLYMNQGGAEEKVIGAYAQLKASPDVDLMPGINYRLKDAMSLYLGLYFKNTVLGLSYDVTTSDLSKMTRGANSFEISLSFTGRKKVKTPSVEFVCPRL
ncbi:PorP/SprF family type IX secretion system membrane protein [Chitinophagaceae bacterium LWZ2-11]